MSANGKAELPPYVIPVDDQSNQVKVYNLHSPFHPQDIESNSSPGIINTGFDSGEGKRKFVSYDTTLGDSPGMTTCTTCQQQVMTVVEHKAGTYAWLMCLLFICCGLVLCCCLIPLLMKKFKDAYHKCPRCNRVLHVEKKQCCK